MTGWVLYDRAGFERNSRFAEILCDEGEKRGFEMKTVVDDQIVYAIIGNKPALFLNGERVPAPDFVIRRNYDTMLAVHLESMGCAVLNNSRACEICNDKLRTAQFVSALGIPTADTFFDPEQALFFPCVVKPTDGHGGKNVFLCENADQFTAAKAAINGRTVVQSVEDRGRDLRTYVSGTKIIASVMRTCENDFRSNFSLGGTARLHEITEKEREIVLRAAQAFDFDFAGIDIIYRNGEPVLNEIEDVVGYRMLYANGITSVPEHIFDRVEFRLREKGAVKLNLEEKTLTEKYIYRGKVVTLRIDEAELPNGAKAVREVIEHNGGVCVAPLTENGELLFVRQFRYPYKEVVLELPAGKLEKGEDAYSAGLRELTEETGAYADGDMEDMGKLYPSPGYCGEVIHMYLARVKRIGDTHFDEDEFLETERISVGKAAEMVMNGEIRDAKTQALVLKLARKLGV